MTANPYSSPEQPNPVAKLTPKSSALAIASLVCGVLAFLGFLFLTGIPAIICGHMAKSRIKKSAGGLTGGGMATAGLITGYLSIILIPIIASLAALATPIILKAKQKGEILQAASSAQSIYSAISDYEDDFKKFPDELSQLEDEGFIDNLDELAPKTNEQWTYFSGQSFNSDLNNIILASPEYRNGITVVLQIDGSVQQLKKSEYNEAIAEQETQKSPRTKRSKKKTHRSKK